MHLERLIGGNREVPKTSRFWVRLVAQVFFNFIFQVLIVKLNMQTQECTQPFFVYLNCMITGKSLFSTKIIDYFIAYSNVQQLFYEYLIFSRLSVQQWSVFYLMLEILFEKTGILRIEIESIFVSTKRTIFSEYVNYTNAWWNSAKGQQRFKCLVSTCKADLNSNCGCGCKIFKEGDESFTCIKILLSCNLLWS